MRDTQIVREVPGLYGSIKVDEKTIQKGLLNVVKNTKLMGRWQKIVEAPEIIVDVAHNK